ncbi:unnamed protein product, partial [Allacma fusca]
LESQGNTSFDNSDPVPYCYLELLFPDACKDPESPSPDKLTEHLYALKIDFKSEEANELLNIDSNLQDNETWNISETRFCTFKEISEFPSNCISNDERIIFRDHVNCSNYDSFEIDRNHNFTNGLRLTCLAPYSMDLKYEVNSASPYDGIKVSFSKVEDLKYVKPFFRIQLQIPGRFDPGDLHDYSGNYTIYSMENHQLERRLKITAAMSKFL